MVGDAIANLLAKSGYDVTKEYYVNDAGAQVTALAWAAYWRYLQAVGTPLSEAEFAAEVPGGLQYRGEYLIPIGAALAKRFGNSLAQPDGGIAAPEVWIGQRTIHFQEQSRSRIAWIDRLGEGVLPTRESVIQEGDVLHLVMREESAAHAYKVIKRGPEEA